jgi:hypothetical protein
LQAEQQLIFYHQKSATKNHQNAPCGTHKITIKESSILGFADEAFNLIIFDFVLS